MKYVMFAAEAGWIIKFFGRCLEIRLQTVVNPSRISPFPGWNSGIELGLDL